MYKKFLVLSVLASLSSHAWSTPGELERDKITLTADLMKAVNDCKCLANAVDRQDKLFPLTSKSQDKYKINTKGQYLELISNMKIDTGKNQTEIKRIINNWSEEKNSPQDLKTLRGEVGMKIQGMSSFCLASFNTASDEIYKKSSILSRKKIEAKQCGVVQNMKKEFKADPLKAIDLG